MTLVEIDYIELAEEEPQNKELTININGRDYQADTDGNGVVKHRVWGRYDDDDVTITDDDGSEYEYDIVTETYLH